MRSIELQGKAGFGRVAIVDDVDYERLSATKWYFSMRHGYAQGSMTRDGRTVNFRMHHMVIGQPEPGTLVDHVNGNKLDNRRDNLVIANKSINGFNRKDGIGVDRILGVKYRAACRERPWMARIKHREVTHYLGAFETAIEAVTARAAAEIKFYGRMSAATERWIAEHKQQRQEDETSPQRRGKTG